MKKHLEINKIYDRFLRNEATAAELDFLFAYFETGDETELRQLIATDLETQATTENAGLRRTMHLAKLQHKINLEIDKVSGIKIVDLPGRFSKRIYFNTPLFKIAASLLVITFLSFFIYNYLNPTLAEEIKPGGNYATLQTADGKKIDLKTSANSSIAKIGGVNIRKMADGQIVYTASSDMASKVSRYNTIVTPLGGKYRITLSDGSIVFLNSASKLEFPVGFRGTERKVKLTGEAYFEVTKDPSKPFVVVSGNSSTEVLGTKFNVSNYPEDGLIKVTLLEGKVRFSGNSSQEAVLTPGEQAVLKGDNMQLLTVNAEDLMAWKDNRFVFKNEELSVIMRKLSRWYNIEVDYNSLPERRLFTNISTNNNLSEVLRMLSVTSGLKFNVDGRRVSVVR